MIIQRNFLLFIIFIILFSHISLMAQETYIRPVNADLNYQVICVGNTGAGSSTMLEPTLKLLQNKMASAGSNSAVIFLGDLLPKYGMPDSSDANRIKAEQRLMQLINVVKDFDGRVFFVPGEHDWGEGKKNGWKALLRMENFIERTLNRGDVFIPSGGFPGPEHIKLTDKIRLIAINTQWLLTDNKKRKGEYGDYNIKEDDEFYVALEDMIMKRSTKDLIIVGHHPIYSNGRYGGKYNPKVHLFPLTLAWDHAYLPLPIIGTGALAIRRNIGDEQYFSHIRNDWMRNNIDKIIRDHEDYIYVSAHEYSQQLFKTQALSRMQQYLISGSAAISEFTATGHKTAYLKPQFFTSTTGFSVLNFYQDGSIWVDFWVVGETEAGKMLNELILRAPKIAPHDSILFSTETELPNYRDSSLVVAPEPDYEAGWLQEFFMGTNHREVWLTPVEVPYIDIGKEHGGLKPVKRGGGQQTISIRLEAADSKQYVLRSVNKDGTRFLPEEIRDTFVAPVSQDFLSYTHPHGAFIIPTLADAAGVYHTNPRLVYVPDDPHLGIYQKLVGNMLMLYEERPNKDMADSPWFGNTKDVVGEPEMKRHVTNDNDYRVDAVSLARARLFDMWISDWDRHKDQWRWASFDTADKKGKVYQPIPRDRDQAFNRLNFFLSPIIKPFLKFQDYRKSYGSLKGLTTNGRQQDHRYLSELEKEDWLKLADSLKEALTDEVIESAFRQWPEPVFQLHGEEMIEIGKVRRDKLPEVAEDFYELHARSVDVVGSNKHERFEVIRYKDDKTLVVVFKTTKEGEIKNEIYRRLIDKDDTDEICLYGLGGNDQFVLKGNAPDGIKLYAVGGTGDDSFSDNSKVSESGINTYFYDSRKSDLQNITETTVIISDDPRDNDYPGNYEYPRTYPFGLIWYTSDDGLVLLGGALHKEHAFRKNPYARQHLISGSYATSTNALKLNYSGTYRQTFGYYWHLGMNLAYSNPNNFLNYFGLGNETEPVEDVDSVRVFLESFKFEIPFKYEDETGWLMNVTPRLWMTNLDDDQGVVSGLDQAGLSWYTLEQQLYAGLNLFFDLTDWDDFTNPRHGYKWLSTFDGNIGIKNVPDDFLKIESEMSVYASTWTDRQYTFTIRFGGAHNFGTFPFFAANTLGGTTNLRGYRSTRFSGRSSLYMNTELRLSLFRIRGDMLPGMVGLIGFFDVGRVWTDGESSNKWHPGYGGGIWYDIADEVTLRFSAGFSEEDTTFLVGPGFFF